MEKDKTHALMFVYYLHSQLFVKVEVVETINQYKLIFQGFSTLVPNQWK